jgi:hypothetical protein
MIVESVIAVSGVTSVVWLYRRDQSRYRKRRADFFSRCYSLFDAYRVEQDALDFPSLNGTYRGTPVRLKAIVDHVSFRKLPSLWLQVTVRANVRFMGAFDMLVRASGAEFYSRFSELDTDVPVPPGWPADASIRTDNAEAMPPLDVLAPHAVLFDDPKMKELFVTPNGVRLTYQAWEGRRDQYVVLRQVEFAEHYLDPAVLRRLLDGALAVNASVT